MLGNVRAHALLVKQCGKQLLRLAVKSLHYIQIAQLQLARC